MTYAVIRVGGKQFMVEKGDTIEVEKQDSKVKADVMYYTDGKSVLVGTPLLSDVNVKLSLVEDYKAEKIRVARFKSKSRYRKVKGHRQPMSRFEVKDIVMKSTKTAEKSTVKDEKPTQKKPVTKKTSTKKTTAKEEKSK